MSRSDVSVPESKLSLFVLALLGAILASCLLITGDSTTVSSGETLPQVLLILATALVAALAGWQVLPWRRSSGLPAVLLLMAVAWLLVSTLAATSRADGRAAWINFWHVLALLMLALTTAQATNRPAMARALLQMIILCAVFQSTYALHQYFVSMPAARAEYIADPDAAIAKAQIDAPPGSELRTQYENRLLGSFEPAGTFVLTNSLAVLLSGVIVALAAMVLPRRLNPSSAVKTDGQATAVRMAYWFARAALLFIICVWLLTKSRSGFLAVLVVGASSIAWVRWGRRSSNTASDFGQTAPRNHALHWALAGVVACVFIGASIGLLSSDRLVISEAPKSLLYRLEYWQATSKMVLDFPLTGVGLGSFQSYYPAYKLPAASEVIADPHNWLFDLAANCSLPLLFVALLGLAWALRRGALNVRLASDEPMQIDPSEQVGVRVFWIGGLVSFVVVGWLQLLMGKLIDFDATMLGLLATVFSWLGIRAIPDTERAVRRSALLAVVTMLVTLLASGCWQASGMAFPLAVLLALCCPSERPAFVAWKQKPVSAYLVPALVAVAFLAFVWQTWRPVQNSWALEQQAMSAWGQGRAETAIQLAKESIAADRLSATSRRLLVQFAMEQAISAAGQAAAGEFAGAAVQVDAALDDLLLADSVSNLNHAYAGECNLALAAGCVRWNPQVALERVKKAAEHYQRAVQRYPTNAGLHAQLAVVQAWLDLANGQQVSKAAKSHVDEAFRLSEITPHINRKLAAQQVFLPNPLAEPFAAATIVRANPNAPWAQAEPLCEFLRKM